MKRVKVEVFALFEFDVGDEVEVTSKVISDIMSIKRSPVPYGRGGRIRILDFDEFEAVEQPQDGPIDGFEVTGSRIHTEDEQ